MSATTLADEDIALLLELLRLDTTSPMETRRASQIEVAQRTFARAACGIGMELVLLEPPPPESLRGAHVPVTVREVAGDMGEDAFLRCQPNLVLRLGPEREPARCIAFNFHMDAVSGDVPVRAAEGRITGRGAADAKGLGVLVLAAIRLALSRNPALANEISVIVQSTTGEEGGAMGVYGTRLLAERGYVGRLNVVCEPTRMGWLDRTTSSMTARISVRGEGSTDDEPEHGHNATVLLGFVASDLARTLTPVVEQAGGKMCIAGLHTGQMHNRVYGTGRLLLNFAYASARTADEIERGVEEAFRAALARFASEFASLVPTRRTAREAASICTLEWLKRGLPVLDNRDAEMERVLSAAGLERHDEHSVLRPFTCDAMWLARAGSYTVVLGPGDLAVNGAHTPGEFIGLEEASRFVERTAALLECFAQSRTRA